MKVINKGILKIDCTQLIDAILEVGLNFFQRIEHINVKHNYEGMVDEVIELNILKLMSWR
jgi:hypothetical protein